MTWLTIAWTILLRPLSYLVAITNQIGGWSYGLLFIIIFLESAFLASLFYPVNRYCSSAARLPPMRVHN